MNIEKARDFWTISSRKGLLRAAEELDVTRGELCGLWSKAMREDREALVFFWNKLCEVYNILLGMRDNPSEVELEFALTTIEQLVEPGSFNPSVHDETSDERWTRTSSRPQQQPNYATSLSLSKELMLKVRQRVDSERQEVLADSEGY